MTDQPMHAVILAGGSGTRFWPLSRKRRPKQFLALEGERSLLQATADRLLRWLPAERIVVCTTMAHREAVLEQLPMLDPSKVLAEPIGRNTAPAIGWSIRCLPEAARRGVIGVFPADHRIADAAAFEQAVEVAVGRAAASDRIMTLGVVPRWPETGYGYLELGEVLDPATGVRRVVRFTEKPDAETAERFVASGDYFWNPGIFVFRGTTLLERLARFEPELAAGLERIEAQPERLGELYPELPSVSIDYGVMERSDDLATVPMDCGWSDLGSWEALTEILPGDVDRNRLHGDALAVEASGNLLWAESGSVAVLGVEGLVVVRTGDAVLVMPRERAQEVRKLVERLEAGSREDLL